MRPNWEVLSIAPRATHTPTIKLGMVNAILVGGAKGVLFFSTIYFVILLPLIKTKTLNSKYKIVEYKLTGLTQAGSIHLKDNMAATRKSRENKLIINPSLIMIIMMDREVPLS
jgi:hypothetical protein